MPNIHKKDAVPYGLLSPHIHNAFILDVSGPHFDRITFKYMPKNFSESKSAQYAQVNILGRSEPVMGYSHSGPRLFNIELMFIAHGEKRTIEQEVIWPIRLIRSWVYPKYNTQFSSGPASMLNVPPRLLFVVGGWLKQRVILLSYNVNYMAPWGLHDVNPATRISLHDVDDLESSIVSTAAKKTGDVSEYLDSIGEQGHADSMLPYVVSASLSFQEVSENTSWSPFDTDEVRRGEDVLVGQRLQVLRGDIRG